MTAPWPLFSFPTTQAAFIAFGGWFVITLGLLEIGWLK